MLNIRRQVLDLLSAIGPPVRMVKPEAFQDLDKGLICYAETTNAPIDPWLDRIGYKVSVYADTFAKVVDLASSVDEAMSGTLGMTRLSKSSDENARLAQDVYGITLNYSAKVINADGIVGIMRYVS